jgi:hypothetical protein
MFCQVHDEVVFVLCLADKTVTPSGIAILAHKNFSCTVDGKVPLSVDVQEFCIFGQQFAFIMYEVCLNFC